MSKTAEKETAEVLSESKSEKKFDKDLVANIKAEVDQTTKELKAKLYPVKLETTARLEQLIKFITFDAEWKNTEALGIMEVSKGLNEAKNKGLNNGCIFLQNLPIEAIQYFLSKVTGKGLTDAEIHIGLVKPFNEVMGLIKNDTEAFNNLLVKLDAAEQGIEVAAAKEETKEAQA